MQYLWTTFSEGKDTKMIIKREKKYLARPYVTFTQNSMTFQQKKKKKKKN